MLARTATGLLPKSPYVCPSCARRLRPTSVVHQKRGITQAYLQKTIEAKIEWAKRATEIKGGREESMLTMLEKRGYVNQVVGNRDDLDRLMTEKRVGIYVGVDPTAASMHVGHLLPLMVLYWAYIKGFHACSLLGGATAQIGDPTGRSSMREAQHRTVRKINMAKMHLQLKSMWMNVEKRARDYGYRWEWAWRREVTNNNSWLNKMPAIELLKLLGQGVRVGTMLGRDSVKERMKQGEGMSFAEFTYPLLQSWDWWHMYSTKDIQVQVGGSDQFGNILAGIDAINYIRFNHFDPVVRHDEEKMRAREVILQKPMGFTVPLLTTKSGEKFGKSAGNAVWLDRELTSAFDLYQFFLRIADADVHRYLKLFTFEPLDVLETLMHEHNKEPSKRVAQHKLAREVLEIVHSTQVARETEQQHRTFVQKGSASIPIMLSEDASNLPDQTDHVDVTTPTPVLDNTDRTPFQTVILPKSLVYNQPITRVLYHAGMVQSRSEGFRLVKSKGVHLGARPSASGTMGDQLDFSPALNWAGSETEKYIIGGDTLILRVGKWNVKIIKIISDEEFEAQGLTAPGWKEENEEKPLTPDLIKMKTWHSKTYIEKAPLHQRGPDAGTGDDDWDKPLSSFVE